MPHPRKLKLGLHTYRVSYRQGPLEDSTGDSVLCGTINYQPPRTITVSATHSMDPAETLLHEILHGVITDRDLDACVRDELSEHLVHSLSIGLMAALRDNKGLAEYLVS